MKASEMLRAAAALPRTRGAWAKNSNGAPVLASSSNAVCFCAAGAMNRIGGVVERAYARPFFIAAGREVLGPETDDAIPVINDRATDAQLDQIWTRAIELAEQAEAA